MTNYTSADRLWHRPDVCYVQELVVDEPVAALLVIREGKSALLLDPETGATRRQLGILNYGCPSRREPAALVSGKNLKVVDDYSTRARFCIERESFAPLGACFSSKAVFLSESAGPLRAFDLQTGKCLWRICFADEHYMNMSAADSGDLLHAVRWNYKVTCETCLDTIQAETGAIIHTRSLGVRGSGGVFVCVGTFLFLYDGTLLSTETGESVGRIE